MTAAKNNNALGTYLVLGLFFCVLAYSGWRMQTSTDMTVDGPGQDVESIGNIEDGNSFDVPSAYQRDRGQSGRTPTLETQGRPRSSRPGPGWRQVNAAAVPAGIDVFRSGNIDTFRGRWGARYISVQSVDQENFGLIYTDGKNDSKEYFASLRFCKRLSFMGNEKVDQLVEAIEQMPALPSLTEGATSLDETQTDSGFQFSNFQFGTEADTASLVFEAENLTKKRIESALFCVVLVDPADSDNVLTESEVVATTLLPEVKQTLEVQLPPVKVEKPNVKVWLVLTAKAQMLEQNR